VARQSSSAELRIVAAIAGSLLSAPAPGLLVERMDALGIDFGVVYPTRCLAANSLPTEAELRRAACRACNTPRLSSTVGHRRRCPSTLTRSAWTIPSTTTRCGRGGWTCVWRSPIQTEQLRQLIAARGYPALQAKTDEAIAAL